MSERVLDDLEPEWLESLGFLVEWDNDERSGWIARIPIASHVFLQVAEHYGSTSLIWQDTPQHELHLGIDDNATRQEVLDLCRALRVDVPSRD